MALTIPFTATIHDLAKGQDFRTELLREAIHCYLFDTDIITGNALIRSYLDATGSIHAIAQSSNIHHCKIRQILKGNGSVRSKQLFRILKACIDQEGISNSLLK